MRGHVIGGGLGIIEGGLLGRAMVSLLLVVMVVGLVCELLSIGVLVRGSICRRRRRCCCCHVGPVAPLPWPRHRVGAVS